MPNMADEQQKKSRGWSWGMLGLCVFVLLLISLLIGFRWYHSTADLDAIREQAKAQGMPVTWGELGKTLADSEDIKRFNRLAILSKGFKDYNYELSDGKIDGDKKTDRLRAFSPIPDKAVQFHKELDQTTVTEALAIIDQIPQGPLVLRIGEMLKKPNNVIGTYRQVVRWLGERVLLADERSIDQEAVRLIRFVSTFDVSTQTDYLIKISLISIMLPNVTSRIVPYKKPEGTYVNLLEGLAQQAGKDAITMYEGDIVECLEATAKPSDFGKIGIFGNKWYDPYCNPLKARFGRYKALQAILSGQMMALKSVSLGDRVGWTRDIEAHEETLRDWHPNEWLEKMVLSLRSTISIMHIKALMKLQVVLAELRNEPWPNDPFDPAGGPLHRVERDGKLMGAYSVGENGIDDGGDKRKDDYFPLYGPLDPPPPIVP
jgi:hypothetical protein